MAVRITRTAISPRLATSSFLKKRRGPARESAAAVALKGRAQAGAVQAACAASLKRAASASAPRHRMAIQVRKGPASPQFTRVEKVAQKLVCSIRRGCVCWSERYIRNVEHAPKPPDRRSESSLSWPERACCARAVSKNLLCKRARSDSSSRPGARGSTASTKLQPARCCWPARAPIRQLPRVLCRGPACL